MLRLILKAFEVEIKVENTNSDSKTSIHNDEITTDQKATIVRNEPEESLVFATVYTVSFENSPISSASQADLKSLEGLIFQSTPHEGNLNMKNILLTNQEMKKSDTP